MDLQDYLSIMMDKEASDLYLITGAAPSIKVHGELMPIGENILPNGEVENIANKIMTPKQQQEFEQFPEMNLALSSQGVGRFRVNIYKQRNDTAMVIRSIKTEIPDMRSLKLPEVLQKLVMKKRGLILFVGATGAGKSSSLASIIDYRNTNAAGHIITIEDPIEFIHPHKKSIITQREVGMDTETYQDALKNTLRQAPDVILIGEIRDQETMEHALAFSETGHLCLSTLHANNANQAMERIIHFFPDDRRQQLLLEISMSLVAVVSQRLIPAVKGGRVPAFEILIGTPLARELIKRNDIIALKEVMQKSEHLGMQTFDSYLLKLYEAGEISFEEAMRNADSKNNLRLAISLKEKGAVAGNSNLSIVEDKDEDGIELLSRGNHTHNGDFKDLP